MAGQFVVPLACLIAAGISLAKRQRRSRLVTSVAQGKATERASDALEGMSWQDFELLVGEAFRLQGYEVTELGGEGPDGGVDLVLRKDREKFLVQCKQWKAFKVGVQVVRELYGVMAAQGAAGGFVVTSGTFGWPTRGRSCSASSWNSRSRRWRRRPRHERHWQPCGRSRLTHGNSRDEEDGA
jgi:restriction system protein